MNRSLKIVLFLEVVLAVLIVLVYVVSPYPHNFWQYFRDCELAVHGVLLLCGLIIMVGEKLGIFD